MRALYTLILLSYFYQLSYSQACGGGKFVFEFYRKDNYELKYEITSSGDKRYKFSLRRYLYGNSYGFN
ncbi:hypothetical protein JJC04_00030 [Flavobacterium covae]|nr:hypothetical protein [Flavobacterium covae]QYS91319.1 hypothetical protein JJC04_00030 [Flavobacterium covae]